MGKLGHHRDWMSGYGNIRQAISHQLGAISLQLGAIYIPPPSCRRFFSLAHRFHFLCLPNSQSSNPFQVKATNEERVIETEVWFDFSAFQLVRNLLVVTSFQKLPLPLNPSPASTCPTSDLLLSECSDRRSSRYLQDDAQIVNKEPLLCFSLHLFAETFAPSRH